MKSFTAPGSFALALTATLLALGAAAPAARAQGDVGGSKGNVKTNPPPSSSKRGPRGGAKTTKVIVTVPKIVRVTPTTGTLTVGAEPNALVEVEHVKTGEAVQARVPAGESLVIFNDLKPGPYRVSAELAGHKEDEKQVLVAPNRAGKVELSLPAITYDVTVSLNVPAGRVMYWKDGGGASLFSTIENGVARLPKLLPGKYVVNVEPNDKTYGAAKTTIAVSGETQNYSVILRRKLTEVEFNWSTANDWSLPAGWRVASGKVATGGKGVALPREEDFRYYKDFQLSADARMVDGVAVSFALRAENERNYYLVQLTGASADEPYVLRGFVVKNNVAERFGRTLSVRHVADTLKAGKFFHLLLTMKGSAVEVRVEDSETGEVVPLGTLNDPAETYAVGAVGIVATAAERNEVAQFVVCNNVCARK